MKHISVLLIVVFLMALVSTACSKRPPPNSAATTSSEKAVISSNDIFMLSSSEVTEGGALPKEFTCDGASATSPLSWRNAPEGTKNFAIIMHHIPGPGDSHWYWVLYNIPANITSLEKNSAGIGTLGNNSVNGKTEYAPPCSKGPGKKLYTYTVYALSAKPQPSVPASDVSCTTLLEAIKEITLTSATLNVIYTR